MVQKSVSGIGIDLVKPMYSNVVVCGGTSRLKEFAERVRHELKSQVPPTVEVRKRRRIDLNNFKTSE
jgi:actin-related protein